ncbi:MAG TPA: hypothetical protein VKB80_33850 [Kofleriaceae bacterium]|nr:hypothetical protein [Kofleriaceae bacterium]
MSGVLLLGALVVVAVAASMLGLTRGPDAEAPPRAAVVSQSARPAEPPRGPRGPRPALDEPSPPIPTREMRAAATEKARGASNPGAVAFRTFSDLYVDHNLDFARKQAESEGITVAEVRELTHFGLLVEATQRVPEVEEVIGHPLTGEQRESLAALMSSANADFKSKMRSLVAAGSSEAERWKLIREAQARYLADFFSATGMNDQLLDDLLAGNVLLPGAPAATQPPEGPVPPAGPRDDQVHPERPR